MRDAYNEQEQSGEENAHWRFCTEENRFRVLSRKETVFKALTPIRVGLRGIITKGKTGNRTTATVLKMTKIRPFLHTNANRWEEGSAPFQRQEED